MNVTAVRLFAHAPGYIQRHCLCRFDTTEGLSQQAYSPS